MEKLNHLKYDEISQRYYIREKMCSDFKDIKIMSQVVLAIGWHDLIIILQIMGLLLNNLRANLPKKNYQISL